MTAAALEAPAVAEPGGWVCTVWPSVLGSWKVIARRGALVLHSDKLTAEQVVAFDPTARWLRR